MTDFRHQAWLQLSKLTQGICKSNLGTKADYVAKHGAVEEGRELHRVIMKGRHLIVSYATSINKPQLGRKGKETTKKQNDDEVKKNQPNQPRLEAIGRFVDKAQVMVKYSKITEGQELTTMLWDILGKEHFAATAENSISDSNMQYESKV